MQRRLAVRAGAEPSRIKLGGELDEVVDFAVGDEQGAVRPEKRLIPGLQIDDRQTPMDQTQARGMIAKPPLAVGTAMPQGFGQPIEKRRLGRAAATRHDAGDAAH